MIAFVKGTVMDLDGDTVVLDVNGVGLSVLTPFSMLQPCPEIGEEAFFHTHLQIREDAWTLFGFSSKEQLSVFRLLLGVSGVGAKTALAIVDKVNTLHFQQIVANQDLSPFTAVSGVGKKTAERILLELKDKCKDLPQSNEAVAQPKAPATPAGSQNQELIAALHQLGYTASEARSFALKAMEALGENAGTEALLKESLKIAMNS